MSQNAASQSVRQHIANHWPRYLLFYSGLIASLLLAAWALASRSSVLLGVAAVLFLAFLYLLAAGLWTAQRQAAAAPIPWHEQLWIMSQAGPTDDLAYVGVGQRREASAVAEHLTVGKLVVIDVYNPQLMPRNRLRQVHAESRIKRSDPRLIRYDGRIDLFPLPDRSVSAVFLPFVLSEIAQHGDRKTLLREIYRVLEPQGRLLMAEVQETNWNRLHSLLGGVELRPHSFWHALLQEAGLDIQSQVELGQTFYCIRADKPSPYAGQQLALALRFRSPSNG